MCSLHVRFDKVSKNVAILILKLSHRCRSSLLNTDLVCFQGIFDFPDLFCHSDFMLFELKSHLFFIVPKIDFISFPESYVQLCFGPFKY